RSLTAQFLNVYVAALPRSLHFDLKDLPLKSSVRGQPAPPESKPVIRSGLTRDRCCGVRPRPVIRTGLTTDRCRVEGSDSCDQFGNISPLPTCNRRRRCLDVVSAGDRKSTRLNSSHQIISYAV